MGFPVALSRKTSLSMEANRTLIWLLSWRWSWLWHFWGPWPVLFLDVGIRLWVEVATSFKVAADLVVCHLASYWPFWPPEWREQLYYLFNGVRINVRLVESITEARLFELRNKKVVFGQIGLSCKFLSIQWIGNSGIFSRCKNKWAIIISKNDLSLYYRVILSHKEQE